MGVVIKNTNFDTCILDSKTPFWNREYVGCSIDNTK